jgi:hypothetical protein
VSFSIFNLHLFSREGYLDVNICQVSLDEV